MEKESATTEVTKEPLSIVQQIFCVFIPLVGIILYFIYVSKDEAKANFAIQLALFGVVVSCVVAYLMY